MYQQCMIYMYNVQLSIMTSLWERTYQIQSIQASGQSPHVVGVAPEGCIMLNYPFCAVSTALHSFLLAASPILQAIVRTWTTSGLSRGAYTTTVEAVRTCMLHGGQSAAWATIWSSWIDDAQARAFWLWYPVRWTCLFDGSGEFRRPDRSRQGSVECGAAGAQSLSHQSTV